ncbi:SMC-Scp complex subunit ScpB [Streptococcus sp. zg-JUN1979]|uniref:SMC-Scp complex subunit ScpB n=1 Tax=Streptococcus sp. zg-JUN1979 TaxID=3391450 RepID=UPI0039A6AB03
MEYLAQIEALLFVAGEEGLSLRQLAELLHLTPSALLQQLEKLQEKYQADELSSLCVIETSKTYKLVTKESFADLLKEFSKSPIHQSLSRASLEVLTIIAYKQPLTRVEVDEIRGVNSSGAISKLLAFGLIKEAGKKEVLGRPKLYVTTDYFLDYIGINQLDDLIAVEHQLNQDEELSLFTVDELKEGDESENQ